MQNKKIENIKYRNKERRIKQKELAYTIHSNDPNRVLNSFEVAVMIGVSETTVRHNLSKHPKSFKIFNKWGMQYKDVIELIENKKKEYNNFISEEKAG